MAGKKKEIPSEDKAGFYITVIFHLAVIIILLASQIGSALSSPGEKFLFDYSKSDPIVESKTSEEKEDTKEEEEEEMTPENAFKDAVARKLDQMLSGDAGALPNVTSSRNSSALKDDRGTDAEKLYADAKRLQQELSGGYQADEDDYLAPEKTVKDKSKEVKQAQYSGPSVLSWQLEGRRASHLPIPAYRCYGGGSVKVTIWVDPQGKVINAKIEEDESSDDKCLRDFAIRAARMSRFSSSPSSPSKQIGNIVYAFIAQ